MLNVEREWEKTLNCCPNSKSRSSEAVPDLSIHAIWSTKPFWGKAVHYVLCANAWVYICMYMRIYLHTYKCIDICIRVYICCRKTGKYAWNTYWTNNFLSKSLHLAKQLLLHGVLQKSVCPGISFDRKLFILGNNMEETLWPRDLNKKMFAFHSVDFFSLQLWTNHIWENKKKLLWLM